MNLSLERTSQHLGRFATRQYDEAVRPQGDKSKDTDKKVRKADPIAERYERRGVSEKEAERRVGARVNKGQFPENRLASFAAAQN